MDSLTNLFTFENITLLIALWGAVLSTAKVLFDHSKDIRKLKVQIAYGIQREIGSTTIAVSISAMNIGYRDVTLNSWGYILPDKKYVMSDPQRGVASNVTLPHTLSEGKQCTVWETQRELAVGLKRNGYSGKIKLRGYYGSAIGKIFKSKPIDFDIEKVLETE